MKEVDFQCARCGSSVIWVECENCYDGFTGHDCGEDCCCCLDPEDNEVCDICGGREGWRVCASSKEFCEANPLPGKEAVKRGTIERFEYEVSE